MKYVKKRRTTFATRKWKWKNAIDVSKIFHGYGYYMWCVCVSVRVCGYVSTYWLHLKLTKYTSFFEYALKKELTPAKNKRKTKPNKGKTTTTKKANNEFSKD